jgi:hypothetical protein
LNCLACALMRFLLKQFDYWRIQHVLDIWAKRRGSKTISSTFYDIVCSAIFIFAEDIFFPIKIFHDIPVDHNQILNIPHIFLNSHFLYIPFYLCRHHYFIFTHFSENKTFYKFFLSPCRKITPL